MDVRLARRAPRPAESATLSPALTVAFDAHVKGHFAEADSTKVEVLFHENAVDAPVVTQVALQLRELSRRPSPRAPSRRGLAPIEWTLKWRTVSVSSMPEAKKPESEKKQIQYTDEFKAGAVALVLDEGLKPEKVVKDLGVPRSSFFRWLKQARIDRGLDKSGALTTEERARLNELEEENRRLRLERELLKKWVAFSATERVK
jgi:transposase